MIVTKAKAKAVGWSSMYKLGDGWVISTWLPLHKAYIVGKPMPYLQARGALTDWRVLKVAEFMDVPEKYAHMANDRGGAFRERVEVMVFHFHHRPCAETRGGAA